MNCNVCAAYLAAAHDIERKGFGKPYCAESVLSSQVNREGLSLGKAHIEVQIHPKCSSKTMCHLVDEKEDAKGFYLGTKTP